MADLETRKPFSADNYVDPASLSGINGGKEFERSDVMFADDVNKIVNNQMYLKDKKADLASPDFSGEPKITGKAIATESYVDDALRVKADLASPDFSGEPKITGKAIATESYVDKAVGGITINNKPFSGNITLNAEDVGAVEANPRIAGGTKCKVTYDHKGLVTYGEDLGLWDMPWDLVVAGNGINVRRNDSGKYEVASDSQLVGFRYPGYKADTSYEFSSSDLTSNYKKGEVQLLFLRLCQSKTDNTVDIPIDLLILMKNTGQEITILGESYSGGISMQVTDCRAIKTDGYRPYMDISVTIKFSFSSRGGDSEGYVRAEWWARRLEHNPGPTGYYQ